jgi:DNA polymerase-3 subunit beta
MKVDCETSAFAAAAGFAARHIPRVPALPALAGLLVTADPGSGLTITGYDIEACSTMTVGANVLEPGRLLLPGRPVAEVLASLPDGSASLTATQDAVRIQTDAVDFSFPTLPIEDYPALPRTPAQSGTVAGAALRRAVAQVATVTARDAIPPVLTAIRLELEPDSLRLAATDRYRLAFRTVDWTADGEPTTVLVPGHLLSAAVAALDTDRHWTLGCDAGHLMLDDGQRCSVLRLLDATYPPVDRLVPTDFRCTLRVDRAELAAAVRRVSLADEQRARGAVVLAVQDGRLTVTGGTRPSLGRQRLAAELSGEPMEVAFTVSFLVTALQALDGTTAELSMNPGVGKVLITATESDSYRHVLMSRQLPA